MVVGVRSPSSFLRNHLMAAEPQILIPFMDERVIHHDQLRHMWAGLLCLLPSRHVVGIPLGGVRVQCVLHVLTHLVRSESQRGGQAVQRDGVVFDVNVLLVVHLRDGAGILAEVTHAAEDKKREAHLDEWGDRVGLVSGVKGWGW